MPRPRKYKTNADRQAAYRKRKAAKEQVEGRRRVEDAVVERVMRVARGE